MVKGSIHQKDIIVVNVYVSNISATNYIKQILIDLKGEITCNTIIVEDSNTPRSTMDRSS